MSGVLAVVGFGLRRLLNTTITIGGTDPYGYRADAGAFGSIGAGTFVDPAGNTRTIKEVVDGSGSLSFKINTTNVPDTDATFHMISVGGTQYQRTAATYSNDDGAGHSQWTWANGATNSVGTSGSVSFEVFG